MKYVKNLLITAIVIAGMFFTSNIYAAGENNAATGVKDAQGKESTASPEKHKWMDQKRQKMWEQLNISPEQKKQLDESRARNKELRKASFENMKAFRQSLQAELMKPQLDMNKIKDIQYQIKALQGQMIDRHLDSVLEVRKILTPEQFSKFIEITGKHGFWHGRGGKEEKGVSKDKIKDGA